MPIGNHSRGTKFLNANHLITPELVRVFDPITLPIDGFYFGRYDLRCRSVADLYARQHIRILELNGAGAEPAHIYQPGFSIWEGWGVLLHHWHILYEISRENHRRGVAYMTFAEAKTIYRRIQTEKKTISIARRTSSSISINPAFQHGFFSNESLIFSIPRAYYGWSHPGSH